MKMLKVVSRASFQRSSTTHLETLATKPPIHTAPKSDNHVKTTIPAKSDEAGVSGISSGWPQSRNISDLRVVVSGEHLNAAHNPSLRGHHMWDSGPGIPAWGGG